MKTNSDEDWCRHYTGLGSGACRAGVVYKQVQDPFQPALDGYPCFKHNNCAERCTSASFLTPEEVAEKMRETAEAMKQYTDNPKYGMCPHCHRRIEEKKQVGRCVYGYPCGHRLYQGTLPKKEKSLEDHPFFREQRGGK